MINNQLADLGTSQAVRLAGHRRTILLLGARSHCLQGDGRCREFRAGRGGGGRKELGGGLERCGKSACISLLCPATSALLGMLCTRQNLLLRPSLWLQPWDEQGH